MSRIANNPVNLPEKVEANITDTEITIKGPLGVLTQSLTGDVNIQKEDSLSLYLMTIKKVLHRNEIAPKSYIKPTIEQMILHQRKLLLLRNIEETLIDDANKKQQFEIY